MEAYTDIVQKSMYNNMYEKKTLAKEKYFFQ